MTRAQSKAGDRSDSDAGSWLVYMLLCGDGTLYTGISNNLEGRLRAHRLGRTGARYTRGRGPLRLVFVETASDRASASRREAAIKRLARKEKCRLALSAARQRTHKLLNRDALRELRRNLASA
jgi:putative endonuclease